MDIDNKHIAGFGEKFEALRRQLDAALCDEQVCRSVVLNRLEVTYDLLVKAADADGLTADQVQSILLSVEHSMLVVESSGRERPVVIW